VAVTVISLPDGPQDQDNVNARPAVRAVIQLRSKSSNPGARTEIVPWPFGTPSKRNSPRRLLRPAQTSLGSDGDLDARDRRPIGVKDDSLHTPSPILRSRNGGAHG